MGAKPSTTLIFDFDGTIADTVSFYLSCINILAEKFDLPLQSPAQIAELRKLGSRELFSQIRIPRFKMPLIVWEARKLLKAGIETIAPIPGIKPALLALQQLDVSMGIITSNSVKNVHRFLGHNELELFEFVLSSLRIWHKGRTLKRLIASHRLDPRSVLYIGDETRDIEAARCAGVRAVAVTWGYANHSVLAEHNPDYILSDPATLVGLVR